MKIKAAVLNFRTITFAAILVNPSLTYPESGNAVIRRVQPLFPTLPVLLVSPQIEGFSRSYALFETSEMARSINTLEIDWDDLTVGESQPYGVLAPELPF